MEYAKENNILELNKKNKLISDDDMDIIKLVIEYTKENNINVNMILTIKLCISVLYNINIILYIESEKEITNGFRTYRSCT